MTTNIVKKPFYFVRHGETDWNRQRIYQGNSDIPLNDTGIRQAEEISGVLKNEKIAHIVSSPLIRARRTADIIGERLQVPITIIDELKEISFGEIEGRAIGDGSIFDNWLRGIAPDDVETAADFDARIRRALIKGLSFSSPTLIVSHGAVFTAIRRILELPYDRIQNCQAIYHQPRHDDIQWISTVLE